MFLVQRFLNYGWKPTEFPSTRMNLKKTFGMFKDAVKQQHSLFYIA